MVRRHPVEQREEHPDITFHEKLIGLRDPEKNPHITKVFLVTQSKWWPVSGNHCRDKFPEIKAVAYLVVKMVVIATSE